MFEFRVDFVDGFEIVSVSANTPAEAAAVISRDPEVVSTTLLGSVVREPAVFLAW